MSEFTDIGPAEDFGEGAQVCTRVGEMPVIVFRVQGKLYAMANVCPHAGLPLGDGERRGLTITCPYHGYTYRLTDGVDIDSPDFGEPAQVFEVREADGRVEVCVGNGPA